MKYLLISILVLAILICIPLGCSPATKEVTVTLSCDDFQKEKNYVKDMTLSMGDKLVVSLCQQSGSTGFSWNEKAMLGNPQALEQTNYKTVPPEKPMPGAPGSSVWTFRTLQPGLCVVDFNYSQQWQGGQKNTWTLKLNVNVK